MITRGVLSLLLSLSLCLAAAGCSTQHAGSDPGMQDPGVVGLGSRNTLTLEINGRRVPRIMLDTGVGGMVLHPDVVEQLALPRTGTTDAVSPGARREVTIHAIDSVRVGTLSITDTECVALDTGFVGSAGLRRINGLIGATLLDHAVVELRLGEARIVVHDPDDFLPPEGTEWVTLRSDPRGFGIDARIEDTPCVLQIDSGAEVMMWISGEATHRMRLHDRDGRRGRIAFMGHAEPTRVVRLATVSAGGSTRDDVTADLVLDPEHHARPFDGVLGRDYLEGYNVILDIPRNRVSFIPID